MLAKLAEAKVPQQIIGGSSGESIDALLQIMPTAQVRSLIWDVFRDWGSDKGGDKHLPNHKPPPAVGNGQNGDTD